MDPASQELQFRGVGVPLANIHRDVGVSGTIGTQVRQGWHQLDVRLAGGDTPNSSFPVEVDVSIGSVVATNPTLWLSR